MYTKENKTTEFVPEFIQAFRDVRKYQARLDQTYKLSWILRDAYDLDVKALQDASDKLMQQMSSVYEDAVKKLLIGLSNVSLDEAVRIVMKHNLLR